MIGWINLSVEAFISDSFGRDAWLQIIKQAHVDCNWVSSCPYPDKVTYDLVITGAGILGVTVPQALEAYGQYFVKYVIKQGYLRLLKSLGSNIAEFLANLNNLHLHLTMGFPSMVAPAFRVEQVTSTSLLLHYHSIRPALWPIVSGVLKGASHTLFNHGVELELIKSREAGDCDHEIFRVEFPHQEALAHWENPDAALASQYGMSTDRFYQLFPFHLLLDTDCCIVQAGSVVSRLFGGSTLLRGSHISDTFSLRHPYIPFDYDRFILEASSLFLLKALQSGLELKGQMIKTHMPDGRPVLLFLGSPRLSTLEEMEGHGLFLSDIPLHDMSRDFVLLAEQRQAEADLKERFEKMAVELRVANERLEQATAWLDEEKQRSDALLYRMLPADIAQDLREGRKVEAINYEDVTILFSDMVGFTQASARSTAEEVYNMLNTMYDKFDALADDFPDIYKLETIGDAYFLVCGLTTHCENHVDIVIDFAIRMQAAAREMKNAQGEPVCIRVGVHSGPVVGGVLGAKTPRFSIYGDTVNVASRMESHGLPGKIHISGAAYSRIVDKYKYAVRERGNITVKGRGNMTTYLIGGTQDDWLLRQSSFDVALDGAYRDRDRGSGSASSAASSSAGTLGGLVRDGSFVITASARSVENLNSNRSQLAMEAIKEGDEDGRHSRTLGTVSNSSAAAGAVTAGRTASGNSGGLMTTTNASPLDSVTLAGLAAAGGGAPNGGSGGAPLILVSGGAGSSAEPGYGGGGAPPPPGVVRSSTSTGPASVEGPARSGTTGEMEPRSFVDELVAPPPLPPPPSPLLHAAPPGGGGGGAAAGAAGSGSFREREGQPPRESSFRETSFRAVYARGGRGPNSPLISGNRAHLAAMPGSGSGGTPPTSSYGMQPPPLPAAAAALEDALGGGRAPLLHTTSHTALSALLQAVADGSGSTVGAAGAGGGGNRGSPRARGPGVEASAGSGFGAGGIVMARSKMSAPSPVAYGSGGSASAATAASAAALMRAGFAPAAPAAAAAPAAGAERERDAGGGGAASAPPPAATPKPLAPVQAAILQQLQAASQEESARARRASASSVSQQPLPSSDSMHSLRTSSPVGAASTSGDGAGAAATPGGAGKIKGLASKLKGLFKK